MADAKYNNESVTQGIDMVEASKTHAYRTEQVLSDLADNAMFNVNKIGSLSVIPTMIVLRMRHVIASLHV